MNKEINFKFALAIITLCTIVFLGIGFAAYTASLTISSGATVTANASNFNVVLSSASSSNATKAVAGTASGSATCSSAAVSATTVSGLAATFTAPGQSCTWTVYARNTGAMPAYLNTITYNATTAASGETLCTTKTKKYTLGNGATAAQAVSVCEGITLTTTAKSQSNQSVSATATKGSITSHSLTKSSGYDTITLKVEYPSSAPVANGDVTVKFGTISFAYSSQD